MRRRNGSKMQARTIPAIAAPESFLCEDEDEDGDEVEDGDGGKPHKPLFPRKALCWNLFNVVVLGIDPLN